MLFYYVELVIMNNFCGNSGQAVGIKTSKSKLLYIHKPMFHAVTIHWEDEKKNNCSPRPGLFFLLII